MKILVTGAAGLIGSCLVGELSKNVNNEVYAFDNNFRYSYDFLRNKVRSAQTHLITGDICNRKKIHDLLSNNIDIIIHLAAIPGERLCKEYSENTCRTNIYGTYILLEEANKTNVDSFIFASSQVVYGKPRCLPITEDHPIQPNDLYSFTKAACENLIEIYEKKSLPSTILRFSSVYGHSTFARWDEVAGKFVRYAMNGTFIPIYKPPNLSKAGEQVIDFVHVRDVADGIIKIVRNMDHAKGKIYNMSYGSGTSILELASIVAKITKMRFNKELKFKEIPTNEEEIPKIIVSNQKIQKEIGWKPKINLEDGMEDLIDRYLNYLKKCGEIREPKVIETPIREV